MSDDFQKTLQEFEKKQIELKQNIIEKQKQEQKNIIQEFKHQAKDNFFYNFDKIENKHIFEYTIILILFFYASSRYIFTNNEIIYITLGLATVFYLYSKRDLYSLTYHEDLRLKLRSIYPKPKYFHTHPELINYFFYIREYKTYNEKSYDSAMVAVDNIINIEQQIKNKVKNCHHTIDVAKQNLYDALNHIHSIIFTLPMSNITFKKHKDSINVLKDILLKIINNMINNCNENLKQTNQTAFQIHHSKIKHFEKHDDNFNFY